jgi:hypothetical protein
MSSVLVASRAISRLGEAIEVERIGVDPAIDRTEAASQQGIVRQDDGKAIPILVAASSATTNDSKSVSDGRQLEERQAGRQMWPS